MKDYITYTFTVIVHELTDIIKSYKHCKRNNIYQSFNLITYLHDSYNHITTIQ